MTGKAIRFVVASSIALTLMASGCHRETTPGTKQARLIAAENMQLKKSLTGRQSELDELKAQHAKELQQKDAELAACRKRIAALESDLEKGIAERVSGVTAAVMDENARLRRELEKLKTQLPRNP